MEQGWFPRGVKESIFIHALKPSLNRDGGRFNLSPIWHNIVDERIGKGAHIPEFLGPSSLALTSKRDCNWCEQGWSSSRKLSSKTFSCEQFKHVFSLLTSKKDEFSQ